MKVKLFFFLTVCLFMITICFEEVSDIKRRIIFYKKIEVFSNNTITFGYSPDKGLHCIALKDISFGQRTIRVPKNLSITPYYIFPFKFEIFNALNSISLLRESVGKEQKLGSYLLTFYVLYLMRADKKLTRQYIMDNNITEYMNCFEVDESIFDSFPKMIITGSSLENEEIRLMRDLGYPIDKENEFETIIKTVFHYVRTTPHAEYIFPWIANIEDFRYAYGLVMSRAMTVMINEYKILEGINPHNLTDAEKKNFEINSYFSQVVGAPCIIAFIDLCNHYQPKYKDLRDKHQIILDSERGYFLNSAGSSSKPGDEIGFTYSNDPSNLILYLHYGFILHKNLFNLMKISVDEPTDMNINQFNLCREVGCFDSSVKDPLNIPKIRVYGIRSEEFNTELINYARIKYLKGEINFNKVMRSLKNEKPISIENEIKAFAYYFKHVIFNPLQKIPAETIIRKIQKYRNKCLSLERARFVQERFDKKLWKKSKTFELIYSMDLAYRNVIVNQKIQTLNKVIKNINDSINDLKKKKYVKNK